ncbi:MAG: hypothetical protein CFE23_16725 [Flavobacterium sp. BFFFF1]|nr:MAG: hypothetical protein CFE23_16725 [Flavobacterium sp. BFFFF1]
MILSLCDTVVLNFYDTYYVMTATTAVIISSIIFGLYAANYFILRRYSNLYFGIINLLFISAPLIYLINQQSEKTVKNELANYLENPAWETWKISTLPKVMLALFALGLIMFFVNIIFKFRSKNRACA